MKRACLFHTPELSIPFDETHATSTTCPRVGFALGFDNVVLSSCSRQDSHVFLSGMPDAVISETVRFAADPIVDVTAPRTGGLPQEVRCLCALASRSDL